MDPGFAYYEVGDLDAPRPGPRAPAMMLMGGGEWVPEAFHWWLKQAGNGRVLILRASGSDELQDRLYREIGGTTAVQTLVFDSRIWDTAGKSARIPVNPELVRAGGTVHRADTLDALARLAGGQGNVAGRHRDTQHHFVAASVAMQSILC